MENRIQAVTSLPVDKVRNDIIRILEKGNALVLTAPPGTGKSTRIPQFMLDCSAIKGRILVLQPRRIAARFLAHRVAMERVSLLGGKSSDTGFITRNHSQYGEDTRLFFITQGVLLEMAASDPDLSEVGAIVFDEFHERSVNLDIGLGLALEIQRRGRRDLAIVVMSATMNAQRIVEKLDPVEKIVLDIPLHEVELSYRIPRQGRKPWDMAAAALQEILASRREGHVLIFMPGAMEIRRTMEACREICSKRNEEARILPLMGSMTSEDEDLVMKPSLVRKVIVATNVAETSLTIPGVVFVVDSGLSRVSRYDSVTGMDKLVTEPVSRFSADQRSGRAGREGPGWAIRLWSEEEQRGKPQSSIPEILRCDLAQPLLKLLALGINPYFFSWMDTPPEDAMKSALKLLCKLGAVDFGSDSDREADVRLLDQGMKMASFPCHPRIARMILHGAAMGIEEQICRAAWILSEEPPVSKAGSEKDTFINRVIREEAASASGSGQGPGEDPVMRRGIRKFIAIVHSIDGSKTLSDGRVHGDCGAGSGGKSAGSGRTSGEGSAASEQRVRGALTQSLALAYPDRLAVLRGPGGVTGSQASRLTGRFNQAAEQCGPMEQGRQYEMADGLLAQLHESSCLRFSPLILALDTIRISGSNSVMISRAVEVDLEVLMDLFPHAWQDMSSHRWNSGTCEVERMDESFCLSVAVERCFARVEMSIASEILAKQVGGNRLPLVGWGEEVEHWIQRVRWVASLFPDFSVVQYEQSDIDVIIAEICNGCYRYSQVRDRNCLPFVKNALSWEEQRFVDEMAPESIRLPSGRKMKIRYTPNGPKGSARIQDFYGLDESPAIARGRARVLLEILAPNMRAVQVTDDLNGFWKNHYPELRKELSRRYPRHEWR